MKLEELAQVMIGILTKREMDEKGKNRYRLFSLKNYEEKKEYEEIIANKELNNKLTQKGDLLFRLLCPNKIIHVDEKLEGILVSSQFCIIRVQKEKIDPIILKWYLESPKANEDLNTKTTGSIIKTVPVANLKTLNIPSIDPKEQEKMKRLILLWEKEKEISKKILEEKEKMYNSYLEEKINKKEKISWDDFLIKQLLLQGVLAGLDMALQLHLQKKEQILC